MMQRRPFPRFLVFLVFVLILSSLAALPVSAADTPIPLPGEVLTVWGAVKSVFSIRSLSDVNAMFESATLPFLLLFGAGALLFALWGYHLSRALLIGGGFVGGWMLGSAIYDPIVGTGLFGTSVAWYVRYIVYIVLGIVVCCLVMKILRTGIFLAAAVSTYFFLSSFSVFELVVDAIYAGDFEHKYLIGRLLVATAVGALALAMTKPVMIVVTAGAGGMLAAVSLCVAIGIGANLTAETIIGIVFAAVGTVSQFRFGRRPRRRESGTY